MKTKKIFLMIPFLFLVMGIMNGCEDNEPQYEIYENHDISACGVEDPLVNIEWLAEICNEVKVSKKYSSFYIFIFKIIDTNEYIFDIARPSQYDEHYSSSAFFDCSGNIVFQWETINPPNPSYKDFMQDKELVSTLFSMVKQ